MQVSNIKISDDGIVTGVCEDPTYFRVKMDINKLDEKLMRFIQMRNELAMLAMELHFEVTSGLLKLEKQ